MIDYGINSTVETYNTGSKPPEKLNDLFKSATEKNWENALEAVEAAKRLNINYKWYNRFLNPKSLNEKYQYAWWFQYYLFTDFMEAAKLQKNVLLKKSIVKAYFTGDWKNVK